MVSIRKYFAAKKIISNYYLLLKDASFLLSVEDLHCRNNEELYGKSMKNKIRSYVKVETGKTWSGKFTESRITKELENLNALHKNIIQPTEKFKGKLLISSL